LIYILKFVLYNGWQKSTSIFSVFRFYKKEKKKLSIYPETTDLRLRKRETTDLIYDPESTFQGRKSNLNEIIPIISAELGQ